MTIKTEKQTRWLEAVLLPFVVVTVLFGVWNLTTMPADRDANYYLPVARAILDGQTPTVDIQSGYTPLGMYAYAMWMAIAGETYESAAWLNLLIQFANALLLYLVMHRCGARPWCRLVAVLSMLWSSFILDGFFVMLEPFIVLFLLMAVWTYLVARRRGFAWPTIGFLLGCAVMSKQHAVLFLVITCMALLSSWRVPIRDRLLRCVAVIGASCIPYILFVLLTPATFAGTFSAFGVTSHWGVSYASQSRSLLQVLQAFLVGARKFKWLFAVPVSAILLFVALGGPRDILHCMRIAFVGIVCGTVACLIRSYNHYFLMIAPWTSMLLGLTLESIASQKTALIAYGLNRGHGINRVVRTLLVAASVVVLTWSVWNQMYVAYYWYDTVETEYRPYAIGQKRIRDILWEYVPPGSEVFVVGGGYAYALGSYRCPFADYSFYIHKDVLADPAMLEGLQYAYAPPSTPEMKAAERNEIVRLLEKEGLRRVQEERLGDWALMIRDKGQQ